MKSEHTSTNCKQNNSILLCATGRCGSNYIMSTISSDPNIFNLGEFFNYKSIWNLYIKMHTLSLMSQKRSDLIFEHKDWLAEMADFFRTGEVREAQRSLLFGEEGPEEEDVCIECKTLDDIATDVGTWNMDVPVSELKEFIKEMTQCPSVQIQKWAGPN